jgi:hypothetical protein
VSTLKESEAGIAAMAPALQEMSADLEARAAWESLRAKKNLKDYKLRYVYGVQLGRFHDFECWLTERKTGEPIFTFNRDLAERLSGKVVEYAYVYPRLVLVDPSGDIGYEFSGDIEGVPIKVVKRLRGDWGVKRLLRRDPRDALSCQCRHITFK